VVDAAEVKFFYAAGSDTVVLRGETGYCGTKGPNRILGCCERGTLTGGLNLRSRFLTQLLSMLELQL
jgi:hypothetical protein